MDLSKTFPAKPRTATPSPSLDDPMPNSQDTRCPSLTEKLLVIMPPASMSRFEPSSAAPSSKSERLPACSSTNFAPSTRLSSLASCMKLPSSVLTRRCTRSASNGLKRPYIFIANHVELIKYKRCNTSIEVCCPRGKMKLHVCCNLHGAIPSVSIMRTIFTRRPCSLLNRSKTDMRRSTANLKNSFTLSTLANSPAALMRPQASNQIRCPSCERNSSSSKAIV
mmetsp:Transcript_141185/g.451300  ORF Transcript_141185/g.451300 Transcript_141185/m.451300 type:complete len:223 (-) Transcript_141185:379-1047(-)